MYFKHDISDICRKKKSHKTATSKKDGNKYTFEYVNKKITASKNNINITIKDAPHKTCKSFQIKYRFSGCKRI